ADRAGFHEERFAFLARTSAGGCANSEREARAAGECRRGGAGAGIGRASARCLATERGGRSPPRVKTGGRAAPRESRPAAELPRISIRRQDCRASRPAAEQPGISTGGRTAGHLHRRQNCRASRPAAEQPGISTGGRTAGHLDRRQNCRASPPAAELRGISTGGRTAEHPQPRLPATRRAPTCGGTRARSRPGRAGAAARSSAPCRAASPPTARASRRCAGWRRGWGTSRWAG
ncbi:MAG: hypothetical protein JWM18_5126, partial [Chloroflexi bacterium]|nr:hypothetical protein [Chloroflexota bacterium]